jgi:holo-[acyl-carrier protein] synthase
VIVGVGIDIVDLEEFRARLSDDLVADVFLPAEIEYASSRARPWESFAARFAAKEAAMKALGAGLAQGLRWRDIEVVRDAAGQVELALRGAALELSREKGTLSTSLSVSHSARSAVAVVILEGRHAP